MSITYTVELSDVQNKALACVAVDPEDWINNAVKERCRIAIDEVFNELVNSGVSLSGTKEEMIMSSQVKTLAEKQTDIPQVPQI